MFNTLDLFAGIGGFSLGLERTGGFRTVAFCEIDKKAQAVLRKHWLNVPIFSDVSTLSVGDINEKIDVITGGFPCQDISLAGRGAGLAGERSGLWYQFHRLIKEIKPKYAIIENVSALRSRGLDEVLRGLTEIGYDAEWHCIPASAVGAPHRRDRIWIVAHSTSARRETGGICHKREHGCLLSEREAINFTESSKAFTSVADADLSRLQGWSKVGNASSLWPWLQQQLERCSDSIGTTWATEPNVGRVAHGVSGRLDRLKQLGNAVVPQIPELIGRAILNYERALG